MNPFDQIKAILDTAFDPSLLKELPNKKPKGDPRFTTSGVINISPDFGRADVNFEGEDNGEDEEEDEEDEGRDSKKERKEVKKGLDGSWIPEPKVSRKVEIPYRENTFYEDVSPKKLQTEFSTKNREKRENEESMTRIMDNLGKPSSTGKIPTSRVRGKGTYQEGPLKNQFLGKSIFSPDYKNSETPPITTGKIIY